MSGFRAFVGGVAIGAWVGARRARRSAPPRPTLPEFDFLALMSHELRTPLNIVLGYLELLDDEVPEPLPPAARDHVHRARLATFRMADQVNNLLTWTRLRSRRVRVLSEPTPAADIVRNASNFIAEQTRDRGLGFETDVPSGLVLRTDPGKACQALRALVVNAVKFTESGTVRVSAESSGDRVRFRVRDTGIGIPDEYHHKIFWPYWQLEASQRRTRGGVGIGLSVARELARLLGGVIVVRSVPGEGSEFVLDLPRGGP